jgi:hypothetical protein
VYHLAWRTNEDVKGMGIVLGLKMTLLAVLGK